MSVMTQAYIERYFAQDCLTPALKAIGYSRQVTARADLFPHHEDHFEIHLVLDGVVNWWVEDETHTLTPGSIYLTKPKERHGAIKNTVQPSTLYWLQVDAKALSDSSLKTDLHALQSRTCQGAEQLVEDVKNMLTEIRQPQADSKRMLNGTLQLFLSKLLRHYQAQTQTVEIPQVMKTMLNYIDESLDSDQAITVNALSAMTNLSRSRVFQLFDQYTKQSPIAYAQTKRIDKAKQYLKEQSQAITQVALDLGYSSSQHFATVFKRMTGMTPREYRKLESLEPKQEDIELGEQFQLGHRS